MRNPKYLYWSIVVIGISFIVATSYNIGAKVGNYISPVITSKKSNEDSLLEQELLSLIGASNNNTELQYILYNTNGVIDDTLIGEEKSKLIYAYAKNMGINISVADIQYDGCMLNNCEALSVADVEIIKSFYGITNKIDELYLNDELFNGYCIYKDTKENNISIEQNNFKINKDSEDVIMYSVMTIRDESTVTKNIRYTFKNKNGKYYLYSVYSE